MNRRIALTTLALLSLALSPLFAQTGFEIAGLRAAPGASVSGFLDVPVGKDGEARIPVTIFNGVRSGPTLALIAGTHGYEYTPILASHRLLTEINSRELSGRVILVHVANMPSYLRRTIYYSPVDGQNLNRVYPGKPDGTLSERIAHAITTQIIERADYLIDMHCGDGNESLRPYSYWMPIGNAAVDGPSKQMALAFGIDHIVIDRQRPKDPKASQYCSNTAMTRGKPAITIESGGMGLAYEEEAIARIVIGVRNTLKHLRMVEGNPATVAKVRWFDRSEVLRFPSGEHKAGVFFPLARKDQAVDKDALLGRVTDFFGKTIHEVRAPFAGIVLYIIGTPPISAGEPLAMVAAPSSTAP